MDGQSDGASGSSPEGGWKFCETSWDCLQHLTPYGDYDWIVPALWLTSWGTVFKTRRRQRRLKCRHSTAEIRLRPWRSSQARETDSVQHFGRFKLVCQVGMFLPRARHWKGCTHYAWACWHWYQLQVHARATRRETCWPLGRLHHDPSLACSEE